MAELKLDAPIKSIHGRISSGERLINRTRNGKTHTYIIQNPFRGKPSPARQQSISAFGEAVIQCKQEMSDPEKLALWQAQYDAYRKELHRHPAPRGAKTYSTLRGYIIAHLMLP